MSRRISKLIQGCALSLAAVCFLQAMPELRGQTSTFVNFESQQTRPVCLSPDGTRLFVVNTPDGRLSVFDVSNAANHVPVLIREVAVGIEPVSVNVLSNDEAWVVNEVSDAVSVVSVAAGMVTDTIACKDEPGDVVFANGRAFVSCSQNHLLRVFDLTSHVEIAAIPLEGLSPHSLAVSNDGARVFAAFKLSGNRTTLLPAELAPAQPAPTNVNLPAPPQVGLIVTADDARLSPVPNLPDHDVAEISATSLTVTRYFQGVGTINFFVAARPGSDELWVANTEARNLVRFESGVKGHAVDNRVTRIGMSVVPTVSVFDLNPGLDYALFPNPSALATALAQPTAIAFTPNGAAFWLASFGTDRVAKIDAATGIVLSRIETGPTIGAAFDPRNKRGPRGLVCHPSNGRVYVSNRLSNTLTILSTATESVIAEVPIGSFDPTPAVVRQGRGFLYDARLSGNGTQSCASCHIDGDRDELAWDLGDPAGSMQSVSTVFGTFSMHPMKGPMVTQTLRGLLIAVQNPSPYYQPSMLPLHWRGDRAEFTAFNPAFASLLGGSQVTGPDMIAFQEFVKTMVIQPNPNQNLDGSLPAVFPPGDPDAGDPTAGQFSFESENFSFNNRCTTCHALPSGTNRAIVVPAISPASGPLQSQNFKAPHLRNVYQKLHFKRSATDISLSGFGLMHDGSDPDFVAFLSRPGFGSLAGDLTRKRNLNAFLQCFDTGTAPAVGFTRSLRAATLAAGTADWSILEAQAVSLNCDLVVRIFENGGRHGFVYRPATNDYLSDQSSVGAVSRAVLEAKISAGATATILGAPRSTGQRLALDRNGNAIPDDDEPLPPLNLSLTGVAPLLAWPVVGAPAVLESTDSLNPPAWQPVTGPRATAGQNFNVSDAVAGTQRFYRLRRP